MPAGLATLLTLHGRMSRPGDVGATCNTSASRLSECTRPGRQFRHRGAVCLLAERQPDTNDSYGLNPPRPEAALKPDTCTNNLTISADLCMND
jgi:hypothetical protein